MCYIEGEALAQSFGCKFVETSARLRTNVDNAFFDIVREVRRYNKDMSGYRGGSGAQDGPHDRMEMDDREGKVGCCSKCSVM